MNLKVKKKNLFLIDDISPYKNFITARKTLRKIYLNSKKNEETPNQKAIVSRNIYNNTFNNKTNIKLRTQKMHNIKSYPKKLLIEQKYIISHFAKGNEPEKDNDCYNNKNSLLKTLDRINYFRYKNDKINMISKYSQNNIFKTIPNENIKHGYRSVKKEKINYENFNLPVIKHIIRKKTKLKVIL